MGKLPYVRGVTDVKSIHTAAVRSIPKRLRSPYLDLYVLAREKERLEKENYVFGKRGIAIQTRLKMINKRMQKLQEEIQEESKNHTPSSHPKKFLKTMSINY
jgi:hypothetical protein